ncbi:hypothetical protein B0T25DRAFT_264959 [Lasiosphaeria hispida]|uniref:Uncharacterized protein n=1 Tax=Lasiosphaeria hispida TaxID=260671 RepID=A0AAJ0HA76_9PEZI|nr:hypothetical protein B0T25DRAFT_264959 [Lasiosphaeria hispida]
MLKSSRIAASHSSGTLLAWIALLPRRLIITSKQDDGHFSTSSYPDDSACTTVDRDRADFAQPTPSWLRSIAKLEHTSMRNYPICSANITLDNFRSQCIVPNYCCLRPSCHGPPVGVCRTASKPRFQPSGSTRHPAQLTIQQLATIHLSRADIDLLTTGC